MNTGTTVSEFSFVRKIGRGGFGEVYEARRISNGETVALKVLDKRKLKKELYRKVHNEIDIHKNLNYHSIVKMHEWFEDANYMYLVLELCSKGDLHHFLKARGKPLPENQARELFAQLVDSVVHLHSNNIVHRDISLNNLLLTQDFSLKLSDFGLAKRLSGPQDAHRTMCGTPNFMSPETLTNSGKGFMGDCWSLGCVLYHLLTGAPPFEDTAVNEILRRVKSGAFHIPKSVSVDARSLIGLLLQSDPNNRVSAKDILKHSFMLPCQTVLSGKSADSGHGTLDSNEFSGQADLSADEAKVQQFLPSFTPLQSCQGRSYLPHFRNALRARPATSTPPSSGPLKIPQRPLHDKSSQLKTKPDCLNTTRIPPRLQQRKGLEVEVCANGSISLRRKLESGTEEFRVSRDGSEITVLTEHTKQLKMSYATLQPRWYSRYAKLAHCVNALKSSTPKVTIHTDVASAYYMENTPEPNFQVLYKDGYKLNLDATRCYLTDPEKRITMATQHMTPCLDMPSSMVCYLDTARSLHEQCVAVEKFLEQFSGTVFPVRMGLPNRNTGHSMSSTTTGSSSYLSQMPCSLATPVCSVAAPTIDSSARHSTPLNTELRRSPSLGALPRSPLTPIQPRRASSVAQRAISPRQGKENEFHKYLPGVGWIKLAEGTAMLQFKDNSELVLRENCDPVIRQPDGSSTRLNQRTAALHRDNIAELQRLLRQPIIS